MFIRLALLSICLLIFCSSMQISAQKKKRPATPIRAVQALPARAAANDAVKITLDAERLPANFEGHNAVILFNNLRALLPETAKKSADAARKTLAGKKIYQNLTGSDFFAFTLPVADSVYGTNRQNGSLVYRGQLYRLRRSGEFPEPRREFVEGCGMGSGGGGNLPRVDSRAELLAPIDEDEPASAIWTESVFHLETVVPKAKRGDYKGYDVGKQCLEFFVPSPQTHYGLSFVAEQPFRLAAVRESYVFSLDTYNFTTVRGIGIAGWIYDGVVLKERWYNDPITPLFIVRLTPPYVGSEVAEKPDPVEGKPNRAVQNKLYVDLIAIWAYNQKTGEIISKNAGDRLE